MARVLLIWKQDDKENWAGLPKSRTAAKELGSPRYFTGKACVEKHTVPRYTNKGACSRCKK